MLHPHMAAGFINADEHVFCVLHRVLIALPTPPAQLPKPLNRPQNWTLPMQQIEAMQTTE